MAKSKYLASPFKWAGSKANVLDHLLPVLEKYKAEGFCEPFVGACNVSLNFDAGWYAWNDLNEDLIYSYRDMKFTPTLYKSYCEVYFEQGFDKYYEFRELFNSTSIDKRAPLFQYLNKHGFNGLCRYNKSGKYNVPIGITTKPKQVPVKQIDDFFNRFANTTIAMSSDDFETVFERVERCDNVLIYSDPPYVPITTDFNYTAEGFGWEQHVKLKELSKASKHVAIISNHWTPLTQELYSDADEVHVFDVKRNISAKVGGRNHVQECIVVYK